MYPNRRINRVVRPLQESGSDLLSDLIHQVWPVEEDTERKDDDKENA